MWQKHAKAWNKSLKRSIINATDNYGYLNNAWVNKGIQILAAKILKRIDNHTDDFTNQLSIL
jgi:hypothetical protein